MLEARPGSQVKVHYTCRNADGTIVDSTVHRQALIITIGKGEVATEFEEQLIGMKPKQRKNATLNLDIDTAPDGRQFVRLQSPDAADRNDKEAPEAAKPAHTKGLKFEIELLEVMFD